MDASVDGLLRKYLAGDAVDVRQLKKRFSPFIRKRIRARARLREDRHAHDIDEIEQDVWASLVEVRAAGATASVAHEWGYLGTIVKARATDWLRKALGTLTDKPRRQIPLSTKVGPDPVYNKRSPCDSAEERYSQMDRVLYGRSAAQYEKQLALLDYDLDVDDAIEKLLTPKEREAIRFWIYTLYELDIFEGLVVHWEIVRYRGRKITDREAADFRGVEEVTQRNQRYAAEKKLRAFFVRDHKPRGPITIPFRARLPIEMFWDEIGSDPNTESKLEGGAPLPWPGDIRRPFIEGTADDRVRAYLRSRQGPVLLRIPTVRRAA